MILKYFKELDRKEQKRGYPKDVAIEEIDKIMRKVPPGEVMLRKCGICGATDSVDFVKVYSYLWKVCRTCQSLFVANPPTSESLKDMYDSDEYASMNSHISNEDNTEFRAHSIVKPKYEFIKSHITTEKHTWFDIGCGFGELLHIVQNDGWIASGIDTNPLSSEFGKKQLGVDISVGYFSPEFCKETNNKYGVVSVMNVLEHCLEPRTVVKAISSLQDVGDNLLVELPHFPSLSAYLCASFPEAISRVLTPPLHLYLFSLDGITALLNDCGYTPISCWMYGQDAGELLDTLDVMSRGVVSYSDVLLSDSDSIQKILDEREFSDHFLVFSKKVR